MMADETKRLTAHQGRTQTIGPQVISMAAVYLPSPGSTSKDPLVKLPH